MPSVPAGELLQAGGRDPLFGDVDVNSLQRRIKCERCRSNNFLHIETLPACGVGPLGDQDEKAGGDQAASGANLEGGLREGGLSK